jgi:hypothetical protein
MKQLATDNHRSTSLDKRQEKNLLGRYFLDILWNIPEERKPLYEAIF